MMLTLPISVLDRLRSLLRRDERLGTTSDLTASAGQARLTSPLQSPAVPEIKPLVSPVSAEEQELATEIVRQLAAQVPYALAVALLPANDRMPLAQAGISRISSPTSMAMQFGRIAQQVSRMAAAVVPQEGAVQELIFTSDQQLHLLRALGGADQGWLYLAVNPQDTNLAMARALMQQVLDSPSSPPAAGSPA